MFEKWEQSKFNENGYEMLSSIKVFDECDKRINEYQREIVMEIKAELTDHLENVEETLHVNPIKRRMLMNYSMKTEGINFESTITIEPERIENVMNHNTDVNVQANMESTRGSKMEHGSQIQNSSSEVTRCSQGREKN